MSAKFIVPLQNLIDAFNLEELYLPEDASSIAISTSEINRPGLQLSGFFDYFDPQRIQILGKSEFAFLGQFGEEDQDVFIGKIFCNQSSRYCYYP